MINKETRIMSIFFILWLLGFPLFIDKKLMNVNEKILKGIGDRTKSKPIKDTGYKLKFTSCSNPLI
jgi:hypothetical protein